MGEKRSPYPGFHQQMSFQSDVKLIQTINMQVFEEKPQRGNISVVKN